MRKKLCMFVYAADADVSVDAVRISDTGTACA